MSAVESAIAFSFLGLGFALFARDRTDSLAQQFFFFLFWPAFVGLCGSFVHLMFPLWSRNRFSSPRRARIARILQIIIGIGAGFVFVGLLVSKFSSDHAYDFHPALVVLGIGSWIVVFSIVTGGIIGLVVELRKPRRS